MDYYTSIKNILINNEINKKVKDYSKSKNELQNYYNVGKLIVEAQGGEERAKYGNKLIKEYSNKLTIELGKGFSETNLKYMRKFYLYQKSQRTVDLLPWGNYTVLLTIKNIDEYNYYKKICLDNKISKEKLRKKIKSNEYERLPEKAKEKLKNNSKLELIETIPNPILIPNNTNLDENDIKEKVLKKLIIENLDEFLKQLGSGYSYLGNEYQLKLGDRNYYIDLLLFNINYNCYIVIEMKVKEFKKEDVSQIKFYMNYIDKNIKSINHDKTIGIILCKKENQLVLEYTSDDRIYLREYKLV